jgi:hypothetical protein
MRRQEMYMKYNKKYNLMLIHLYVSECADQILKSWNNLFCRTVSFLCAPHCQCCGVGQDMKHTYMFLWYPLFQAQCDRCDQQNHQA